MSKKTVINLSTGSTQTVDLTDEELKTEEAFLKEWNDGATDRAWAAVREERNKLIAETDWWASSDLTITDEQRAYRQALRDVPSQGDPLNITWPTKPE
tara:strand:+ start:11942 stop:12235 length:294 start_codon:yes stop_codon:yes gene_type:complete